MRSTVDARGRIVVPKAVRDAMGLAAGRKVGITYVDGHLEIDLAPASVHLERHGRVTVLEPDEEMPALTDGEVRDTWESIRR